MPLLWGMLIVRDVDSGVCWEWRMLRMGEAVHVCSLGKIWEISLTFTQFCCELKIALKIKFIKTRTNKIQLINSLDNLFPLDGYTTHLTFLFLAQLFYIFTEIIFCSYLQQNSLHNCLYLLLPNGLLNFFFKPTPNGGIFFLLEIIFSKGHQ